MALNNPHDTFFESVFSEKENAIDHLEVVLPPGLYKNINLNKIRIEKKSYLDDELRKFYSDIVYSGYYKNHSVKLSFLYEHKSYVAPYPHFQILRYMLNIWDISLKQKEKLPIIIPIMVYHGKEKWNIKPLHSYFDTIDEDLMPFIPDFTYILSDLSMYSKEYIKRIEQIFGKQGVNVMTVLEHIELKARKEGKEEQKLIDKQDILIRQLNKKFSLSGKEIAYIKAMKDTNKLDLALDEILFSDSKTTIFDILK